MKSSLKIVLFLFILFSSVNLFAQNRISFSANIKDTLNEPIAFATVMLLKPSDSTLENFTTSDYEGFFQFKNIKNTPYLLKISHLSHIPYQKRISFSAPDNHLGSIVLAPINKTLVEVIIKAAKAPIFIKGDTIEYDASTFKIPEGSNVEDLLRRLPGIEVDEEGNISTQGKDVRRVYVDGKSFFGDDPKMVTKNLDAEAVSKVQVFTEKSEQSKLTGLDDGAEEKAVNLELKEEFKKGSFGKLTLAGGSDERWAGKGNYNKFNEKHQLSFIGYANNINESNVNWDDYSTFSGTNTFNNDNGDFGFGSNDFFYYSNYGGRFNSGKGFTENAGIGTNYNFDTKKLKYNINYFYKQTDYNYDQLTSRQTYIADSTLFSEDTLLYNTEYANHTASTRLEWDIDSNNVIIAKANFISNSTIDNNNQNTLYSDQYLNPISQLLAENTDNQLNLDINTTAIYRHKFKKKGNVFALSGTYIRNAKTSNDLHYSQNEFLQSSSTIKELNFLNLDTTKTSTYKGSALLINKLSKVLFIESFYNFRSSDYTDDYQTSDNLLLMKIDSLSYYGTKSEIYHRIGSSLRYSNNGLNLSVGLAAQEINAHYKFYDRIDHQLINDPVDKKFRDLVPNISMRWNLPKNYHVWGNYRYNVTAPTPSQILPTPIIESELFIQEGNPELEPSSRSHVSVGLRKWNLSTFSNFTFWGNYSKTHQQILYDRKIEFIDGIGIVTSSYPINYKGGDNLYISASGNYPIIKTKLTAGLRLNGSISNGYSLISSIENKTKSHEYTISPNLKLSPGSKLIFNVSGSYSFDRSSFDINQELNQITERTRIGSSIKWQFYKKFFFESNFNYSKYQSNFNNYEQTIPLWNASIRKLFGQKNRVELRLAVIDIFNKKIYYQQYASANYFTITKSNTLSRYFLLSFTYDVRGLSDKLKKNRY